MPAATSCPAGCADPCVDWHDWKNCPACHSPFHYWQWTDQDVDTSKQRLGERVYICACLLWTALHDRRLGQSLQSQNPNWSAVCNYYSMVHGLRLFWFLLYGSYPTGHSQLAQGLRGSFGARADWRIEGQNGTDTRISSPAFQRLLKDEFNAPTLSLQVPLTGEMFEEARRLRNDSNYESLILAHQYSHGGLEVYIPDEMAITTKVMSRASKQVLRYMAEILSLVFLNDRPWIGNGSPYSGAALQALLWRYVFYKIRGANNDQPPSSSVLLEWFDGLPGMEQQMKDATSRGDTSAHELIASIRYTVFGGKQSLMRDFQRKVKRLRIAVERLTGSDDSQSELFN